MDQNKLPLDIHYLGIIRVCPKRFPCAWYIRCKPCTYLAPRLTQSQNGPKQASIGHTLPRSTIRMCPKRFPRQRYIRGKPCTYLTPKLILSPNGPKQASTRHTLPRIPFGCAQSDFRACGTFGANRAPILR